MEIISDNYDKAGASDGVKKGEVSYFFVTPSIGPPNLTNQRVSSLVFKVSRIIE